MKSWKTTAAGAVAAAASGIASANLDPLITKIAGIVAALATGLVGLFARDNDKSSEDVAAK
jgi:hypothetical protein